MKLRWPISLILIWSIFLLLFHNGSLHAAGMPADESAQWQRFFDGRQAAKTEFTMPRFPVYTSKKGKLSKKHPSTRANMLPQWDARIPKIESAGPVLTMPNLSAARKQKPRVSSLQLVLEHCRRENAFPGTASPTEFMAAYSDCLRRAKGLYITRVVPHHSSPWTINVYGTGRSDQLIGMGGMVTVPGRSGPQPLRIEARHDLLPFNVGLRDN